MNYLDDRFRYLNLAQSSRRSRRNMWIAIAIAVIELVALGGLIVSVYERCGGLA